MEPINALIKPFIASIATGAVEIYNEFSLQHELGIFLRGVLPECKVQFERNVRFFFPKGDAPFIKREMDIAVFSPDKSGLLYAFELKYPRNGQYPEQMFSFCKDLQFAEQLKGAGFLCAAVLIFAEDKLFHQGSGEGIYGYFRTKTRLTGRIQKPTGPKNEYVFLSGNYQVDWQSITQNLKYTVIDVH